MRTKGHAAGIMKAIAWSCCAYGVNAFAGSTAYSPIQEIQFSTSSIYVRLDTTYASNINGCANWGGWFILRNGTASMNSFELAQSSAALTGRLSGIRAKIISGSCDVGGYNRLDGLVLDAP